jgi:hypothetical protein
MDLTHVEVRDLGCMVQLRDGEQEGETLIQHCIYAGGERQPHWAAIASAIPWNVVERSFHLSFEGGK